jgi:hypothetical protein
MKRLHGQPIKGVPVLLILSVLSLSLVVPHIAWALIYDDFSNGTTIDPNKWVVGGYSGLFSEHDGRLYFYDSNGTSSSRSGGLRSVDGFSGSFNIQMEFYDFSSTNQNPINQGKSSSAGFRLGVRSGTVWTNYIDIARSQNAAGGNLGATVSVPNGSGGYTVTSWYVQTSATSGQLGFVYDGTKAQAFYDTGSGWLSLGSPLYPTEWTTSPLVSVWGASGPNSTTGFQVDNVTVTPAPPSLLLILPGLAGLLVVRKRRTG